MIKNSEKKIFKIVITGGPCGGKSAAVKIIKEEFEKAGYTVLCIAETATELITGGVAPWSCAKRKDYQKCQIRLQLTKEAVFEYAAMGMKSDKILIVCDRGLCDSAAYMGEDAFEEAIAEYGLTFEDALNNYDGVFHLVTAAKGAEEFYTVLNNNARKETPEEAAEIDGKLIHVWEKHPMFVIIENRGTFEEKMSCLKNEIHLFLKYTEEKQMI